MRLYYDLRTSRLLEGPGLAVDLTTVELKHCSQQVIEVQFGVTDDETSGLVTDAGDNWESRVIGDETTWTVNDTTDVLTLADATNFSDTDLVYLRRSQGASDAFPTVASGDAIDEFTGYYVRDKSGSTIKLARTSGGTAIDFSDTGTGEFHIIPTDPEIWVGIKADDKFDQLPRAVVKTHTLDGKNHLYRLNLNLATKQVRALLGRESAGDGTTFTADAGTDKLTLTTIAEVSNGDRVLLTNSGGALPTAVGDDLEENCEYWVSGISGSTLDLYRDSGLTDQVDLSGAGTGTHTITRQPDDTNDVAKVEDNEFEVTFRLDTSADEWRPNINPVACTLHNSVFDDTDSAASSIDATSNLTFTGTLADGSSDTGVVSYGETLSAAPGPEHVRITFFPSSMLKYTPLVALQGDMTTTGYKLTAGASNHGGIDYAIVIRRP